MILLAIALALTPARCEAISHDTYQLCRWPNVDPFAGKRCDHLNKLYEACRKEKT